VREPGLGKHLAQTHFTGLRTKAEADFLRQRIRSADKGRRCVKQSSDRVDVVVQRVVGERLDQQHRAVVLQRLVGMPGRADRVAHVVQAVEVTNQVIVAARVAFGGVLEECRPAADPTFFGALSGNGDRRCVVIEADEIRVGKRLGHDHRRSTVTTADIGDFGAVFEFRDDAFQCRQPFSDQVTFVAGAEEAFGAAEHARMVIAPGQGTVAAHGLDQFVLVVEKRRHHTEPAGDVHRRVFDGQCQRLFFRQAKLAILMLHVAGGSVGAEPFTHQSGVAGGLFGEGLRADRLTVGHCPIQPEFFANDDVRQHCGAAHVVDQFAHECVESGLVHHMCSSNRITVRRR